MLTKVNCYTVWFDLEEPDYCEQSHSIIEIPYDIEWDGCEDFFPNEAYIDYPFIGASSSISFQHAKNKIKYFLVDLQKGLMWVLLEIDERKETESA